MSNGNTMTGAIFTMDLQHKVVSLEDKIVFFVNGQFVLELNRTGSDGDVLAIKQAGTSEGSISISGSTTSYNAFTGSALVKTYR